MKKFSELIEDAVNCIKTYNRVIKTIDSHADDFLAAVSASNSISLSYSPLSVEITALWR
jgi:hypothetical protein